MALDRDVFTRQFDIFKNRIAKKARQPFVSFKEGLPLEWEGYKEQIRLKAIARLSATTWQASTIGKGEILKRLISAIEIPPEGNDDYNNLVRWRDENGHESRSHHILLDARNDSALREDIEAWAFEFYRMDADPGTAFEKLREIVGSRYDLLAYLFFLKDSQTFMPIGAKTFDKAFEELEMDVKTAWKCSWSNYQLYLDALQEIRDALGEMDGLADVRLVDAHSFCWLLVRPEMERPDVLFVASAKGKATNAKLHGAMEKSIYEMVEMTLATVRNSNGQLVTSTKKVKELWMSKSSLDTYVRALLEQQGGKCNLTQLNLQFRGEHTDEALLPSLDRIDSDKQYEDGNLQVVCRFINKWKSATPDEEFRRLLSLVRGGM